MHFAKILLKTLFWIALALFWAWCVLAIYFSPLPGQYSSLIAAALFAAAVPLALLLLPDRRRTERITLLACVGVLIGWGQIKPSHDRIWEQNFARLPSVVIDGNTAHVYNVRNFDYTSENEYTPDYYDKSYDLNQLESVDYILSYWDGNRAIAHTILSFGFANGDHLAVSVETRLEAGELQTNIRGFFKQYELIYILADERDLLRLRTNFRMEEVYLYPLKIDKEYVRKMFDIVVERVNAINRQPEFYNALTQNCFTSLAADFQKLSPPENPFDYRRLATGYSDEMLYDDGYIDNGLSFEETRRLLHINPYVQDDDSGKDYSRKIRPLEKAAVD
jgi:hypothetical protein